jgi:uncharacterized membrane protein YphA (DoxX/SURF4 family)
VLNVISQLSHIRYLVPKDEVSTFSGRDATFLFEPLTQPGNILLIIGIILILAILYFLAFHVRIFKKEIEVINERSDGYGIFIPWILRLSLGLMLIGSGINETLISPVLNDFPQFGQLQILLGFFLLAGFLVLPSTATVLALYIVGLFSDAYIVGNLDVAVIAVALLFCTTTRPGLDDIFGIPNFKILTDLKKYTPLVLRIGIGIAMIFLALYEKLLNPHLSEVIVNRFDLQSVLPVSPEMWVLSAGIIELLIGVALLIGFRTRLVASVAFVVLGLSFFYFGESVTSHVTLFGILSALFITRGGTWSVDNRFGIVNKKL